MIFSFTKALFIEDLDIKSLNQIWSGLVDRHFFYQNDDDDIEATLNSDWFQQLSDADQEVYRQAVVSSMQCNEDIIVQVIIGETHTPYEALHYLGAPLKIILENSKNDSKFLNALFRSFPDESKAIVEGLSEIWVEFALGGGQTTIKDVIETEVAKYHSERFPKSGEEYLKCFVLFDSDKTYRDAAFKNSVNDLIGFLESKKLPYHVLEKREMENYIPDSAFGSVENNREFIEAYLRLNAEQKDYFDLEKGLPDKNFDTLPEEIKILFDTVSEDDKKIFRKNDLTRFSGAERQDFKTECPELFNSEEVTRETLLERTRHQSNPNELKDIIQKIREQL